MLKQAWLKILAYCKYYKSGYPLTQIRFFRKQVIAPINSGKLYRRSKIISTQEHWNQTITLGELSTNWSKFCLKEEFTLLDSRFANLYNPNQRRVLICDLDRLDNNDPLCKILSVDKEGELKILVHHKPDDNNYSHCHIDCYLTTFDGEYSNCLIPHEDYDKFPLKKQLAGLRKKYKAHLLYHFNEYKDYDINIKQAS